MRISIIYMYLSLVNSLEQIWKWVDSLVCSFQFLSCRTPRRVASTFPSSCHLMETLATAFSSGHFILVSTVRLRLKFDWLQNPRESSFRAALEKLKQVAFSSGHHQLVFPIFSPNQNNVVAEPVGEPFLKNSRAVENNWKVVGNRFPVATLKSVFATKPKWFTQY